MKKENGIFTYKWNPLQEIPILKITKSSLGTYGFCPASYNYSYIEGVAQETSEAMIKGSRIHDGQEKFWNTVSIEDATTILKSSSEDGAFKLQEHFRSIYPEAHGEDYEEIYRAMSAYNAERFVEMSENEEENLDNFIPVGNEIMLDAKFTTECGTDVHLQGIIDRIFLEDGGYIPMELKTGKWKESAKTRMRKEMAFYKLLYENATEESLEKAGLDPAIPFTHWGWYFPASNYVYAEKVSDRSEQAMLRSIAKLINSYKEDEFDFAYFYKKCIHCGHFNHCEAAGGGENDWF